MKAVKILLVYKVTFRITDKALGQAQSVFFTYQLTKGIQLINIAVPHCITNSKPCALFFVGIGFDKLSVTKDFVYLSIVIIFIISRSLGTFFFFYNLSLIIIFSHVEASAGIGNF